MGEPIEGRPRELFEKPNFGYLATLRKDGRPMVRPTWVDVEGDLVMLNDNEGRGWVRDLRRDPRVTITVADRDNPYLCGSRSRDALSRTPKRARWSTSTGWPRSTWARKSTPSWNPGSSAWS